MADPTCPTCLIAVSFKALDNGRYTPDAATYSVLAPGRSGLLMEDYEKTASEENGPYLLSSVQCEPWGDPYVPDKTKQDYVSIDGFTPSCADGLASRFFNSFLMSYEGVAPMVLPKPLVNSGTVAVSAEISAMWNNAVYDCLLLRRRFSRGIEVRGSEYHAGYPFIYQLVRFTFKTTNL